MERKEISRLIAWKNSENRKPLLIRGARQVGKTWLMKAFGKQEYEQCVYINFESNRRLGTIFETDFDIKRIILALQIETGIIINPENTLIILDEIQEAQGALTSLKYFHENAQEYHIISAGSLLGVALNRQTSFPVGKVEFLDLHPLSFIEFLHALGESPLLQLLESQDWLLIKTFKTKYIQLLKQYYYVGGMPEAVLSFSKNSDFDKVRDIQKRILESYEQDFSKHAPREIVPRIRMLWQSTPAQLAKENKKFIYGIIKEGARAKEYELAMSWLTDCGLIYKVNRITKPAIPLKAYEDFGAFKLFIVDIGLLGAMVNMDVKTLLEGNVLFEEFKGALTEQFVMQQLITFKETSTYYWSAENATAEIDFLIQFSGKIIPVEVKAEENLKAKSLKVFYEKYSPALSIRTSMSDFRREEWLVNLPLYALSELTAIISKS
ncbi:ATP-binding protein [Dyadobacter sp. CY356]|uniref:ATP-binding protein n=1 Tax=Dyadobacter sp. CY356 TaxID=2906442 RepID=UPI001F42B780|nr:ATP-binding protein [Dyadobacter sp. CY356]MCF0059233.1 ATP-binding protein [Dyadobacter sp. CY356]